MCIFPLKSLNIVKGTLCEVPFMVDRFLFYSRAAMASCNFICIPQLMLLIKQTVQISSTV